MNTSITAYFDKASKLSIKNAPYRKSINSLFNFFLADDEITLDVTTLKLGIRQKGTANIIAKQKGIVAGLEEVVYYFSKKKLLFSDYKNDGDMVEKNDTIAAISGSYADILALERTIINILQRMSGIATATNNLQQKIGKSAQIAATRKTHWGKLDKKAVSVGGGLTHRLSLADEILVKDNHIEILSKKNVYLKDISDRLKGEFYEIEVESTGQLDNVLKYAHAENTIVLLDNFALGDAADVVSALKKKGFTIELSGGITEDNVIEYARIGADILSVGSLTHSTRALDMSLDIA